MDTEDEWRDSGEGPWQTEAEAVRFAEAEVGLKWCVVKLSDGWHVLVREE